VLFSLILGVLASLSVALLLWQWIAAVRFPLHQPVASSSTAPPVTCLKTLKGRDASTENCLRSWLAQDYPAGIQFLFGVADPGDPACELVQKLIDEYSKADARLVICSQPPGANAKASKLAQLELLAKHDVVVISDADVRVPPDFLRNAVAPFASRVGSPKQLGLVSCFYCLADPITLAMQWEAVAVNADFWSQVLQSRTLKRMDFALGAVMVTTRRNLDEIGGFKSLVDCLADDYQLGNRIARRGYRIDLCPAVVECWDPPMDWGTVWRHQLRWARTIRVCQPAPYFFSILSNATLWPVLWLAASPSQAVLAFAALACASRILVAADLQSRLTRTRTHWRFCWMVPIKDLLQVGIWFCAFAGNRVEWRGIAYRLHRDGTLSKADNRLHC